MRTFNEFMDTMYESDKELVGKEVTDISIDKATAIVYTLVSNFKPKSINAGNVLFVCDQNEKAYVIPKLYKESIETYGLDKPYFEDRKPKMYQVNFIYKQKACIIYLVIEGVDEYALLANDAALDAIKNINQDILANVIKHNVIVGIDLNPPKTKNIKLTCYIDNGKHIILSPLSSSKIIDQDKKEEIYKTVNNLKNIDNMLTEENPNIVKLDLWYFDKELDNEYMASIYVTKDKNVYLTEQDAHIISMFNINAFKMSFIGAVGEKLNEQGVRTRRY